MLATVCLLLVGVASSAEAIHIHGQWLPHSAVTANATTDGSQTPGGEEHCPLCIAMHSVAMPVALRVEPVQLVLMECSLAQVVDRAPEATWHFALFSRPPPVKTL